MGIDNTILSAPSEFRYTMKTSSMETTVPQSGKYSGYFLYKTDIPKRVYERDLSLDFSPFGTKFQLVGNGTNEYGSFSLIGVFDPTSKDLTCVKELYFLSTLNIGTFLCLSQQSGRFEKQEQESLPF